MNPLANSGLSNGLPPEIMQNIYQVRGIMKMCNGNPNAILQQLGENNPMFNIIKMCNGHNPQELFMSMCKSRGYDPNAILNELRK